MSKICITRLYMCACVYSVCDMYGNLLRALCVIYLIYMIRHTSYICMQYIYINEICMYLHTYIYIHIHLYTYLYKYLWSLKTGIII